MKALLEKAWHWIEVLCVLGALGFIGLLFCTAVAVLVGFAYKGMTL